METFYGFIMNERSKYSLNGVYRIENFAQHLAENTFPTVQIGTAGGIRGWYIVLKTEVVGNDTFIYPITNVRNKPQCLIHHLFNILGKNGKSFPWTSGLSVAKMNILEVLNEKNEYLDNGALVIEYGVHVISVLGDDGIWKFNFNDKLLNPNHNLTIPYNRPPITRLDTLYAPKQLLIFHSPCFQFLSTLKLHAASFGKEHLEKCLQMAHGVRIQLDKEYWKTLYIADSKILRNVIQYADQQLVEMYWNPEEKLSNILIFESCIIFGLRHLLAHLVNHFERLEDLKNMVLKLDVNKMSGEAMKTFAAKILKEKSQEVDRMVATIEGMGIENVSGGLMKTFLGKILYGER